MRQREKTIKFLLIPPLFFIPFMFFLVFGFKNPPAVEATGGAFKDTKHGGGTVDGIPFSGVDRALNPDFALFYNDAAGAGKYEPGECTHCHEPHASFGQIEPKPNTSGDSGPDRYLLMKEYGTSTNYANLCWYCHDNMSNINSSGSPVGMGRWSFYQGSSLAGSPYRDSSHYNSSLFYWPGDGAASPIWPRRNRSGLPTGNRGSCLNCHTPHGIKAADAASAYDTSSPDGSGGVPAAMQTVASGNPSVTSDYMIPRQLISWEETLCERCHDSTGPWVNNANIQDEINKRYGGSGHPVDDTSLAGRHVVSEDLPMGISAPDPDVVKHVECYDCHNPHAVKAPTGVLDDGDGGRVKGMKYVDISGAAQEPEPIGVRQPYVYEVCFKCHGDSFDCIMPYKALGASDGAAGCTPLTTKNRGNLSSTSYNDQRGASNKKKEFDPNTAGNSAYHPVYQAGRNTSIQLCNQLKTAFSLSCADQATATAELSALTIDCTDCHNNEATGTTSYRGPVTQSNLRATDKNSVYTGTSPVGPHGSTNYRILRANYNTEIRTAGSSGFGGHYDATVIAAMDSNFALCF